MFLTIYYYRQGEDAKCRKDKNKGDYNSLWHWFSEITPKSVNSQMIFSSICSEVVKSNRSIHNSVLNLFNLCTLHICLDKFRILSYSCLKVGVLLLATFMYLHIFIVLWNLSNYKYWINLLKPSKGFSHSTYHFFPVIISTIDVRHFNCNNRGEIMNWKPLRFCVQ